MGDSTVQHSHVARSFGFCVMRPHVVDDWEWSARWEGEEVYMYLPEFAPVCFRGRGVAPTTMGMSYPSASTSVYLGLRLVFRARGP